MTGRKPAGMDGETWADVQIREAMRRGAFDNLPGTGKPLPDRDGPVDEQWWLRDYVRREDVPADVLLPPALRLRKRIEQLPETIRGLPSEHAVRDTVAALNKEITDWLRIPIGPWRPLAPVNPNDIVQVWRSQQQPTIPPDVPPPPATPSATPRTWWNRLTRRRRKH